MVELKSTTIAIEAIEEANLVPELTAASTNTTDPRKDAGLCAAFGGEQLDIFLSVFCALQLGLKFDRARAEGSYPDAPASVHCEATDVQDMPCPVSKRWVAGASALSRNVRGTLWLDRRSVASPLRIELIRSPVA
jgi:hypothetical protein